jgi:hypothetical protein
MFSNIGLAFSDVTASVPTNLISSIATSTSFSSIEQISPEAASEIQETTSSIVDSDALYKMFRKVRKHMEKQLMSPLLKMIKHKNLQY